MYTEGHLWRLAHYGEQLAVAAGLSAEASRAVWQGGLLHDIGKIGVADGILQKPAPLTPEEYAQVKQHPEYGARIIAPLCFARDVAPIVRGRHEHWDGSGYPYGLRGEEIPVGARIIAIVDAYDAMTTDRPYSGCCLTCAYSSSVNGAGFCKMPSATPILPMSCNNPPCHTARLASALRPAAMASCSP